ncbi:MAG: UvrD-helicase domain-containing protein [Candidatus Methanoperedens sp.]|nr:UvrD-helicase domain-containing protein [Candidatus Methanoperedens sp.]
MSTTNVAYLVPLASGRHLIGMKIIFAKYYYSRRIPLTNLKRWCIFVNSLLSTLKPRQLEAIKHTQAPQLILAGAGAGNTTTITAKIAYMVEKENIDPSRILALTFSKEAARNMRE